jgi:tetratricopeptide (TPR) repeat protein
MFCTKCGTPLQEGAKFCVACGTAVAAVSAPQTPIPESAAPQQEPVQAVYQAPPAAQQQAAAQPGQMPEGGVTATEPEAAQTPIPESAAQVPPAVIRRVAKTVKRWRVPVIAGTAAVIVIIVCAVSLTKGQQKKLYTEAKARYEAQDYAGAVVNFTTLLKKNAAYEDALFLRGAAYYQLGNYNAALSDLNAAIEGGMNYDAKAYQMRALILASNGNYDAALDDARIAARANPDDYASRSLLGLVYFGLKNYQEAVTEYSAAIKLNPNDTAAYHQRGTAFLELKKYEEAAADFARVLNTDPGNAGALEGIALAQRGSQEEAAGSSSQTAASSSSDEVAEFVTDFALGFLGGLLGLW